MKEVRRIRKKQNGATPIFWLFLIFFLVMIGATGFAAWYKRMTEEKGPGWFADWLQSWMSQPAPTPLMTPTPESSPPANASVAPTVQPTDRQKQVVLSVTYKPEVVREGEKQKLTFQIKNETGEVLTIKEAKINWYWDQGQGFSLAEQQEIAGSDPRWLAPKVPEWSTKTVFQETTTASGRGAWRGEITVFTNLKNLTVTVTHTVQ
jgi:hypothetical protein